MKYKIDWVDKQGNAANLGLDEVIEASSSEEATEIAEYYFFLDRGILPEKTQYHVEVYQIEER